MLFFFFVALKTYGGDDGLIVRRRNALPFIDTRDGTTFYWICLFFAVAWFALMARIVKSRFGRVLEGIRQSERRMAAMGVSTYRYKLACFVISGMGLAWRARDGQSRALRFARHAALDAVRRIHDHGDPRRRGTLFGPAAAPPCSSGSNPSSPHGRSTGR